MTNFFTDNEPLKVEFLDLLKQPRNVVITAHMNPDGDAYGSSLGLFHVLGSMGHTVHVISPTDHAAFLNWMPGVENIINYENCDDEHTAAIINEADLICCLDFSVLNRAKGLAEVYEKATCRKLMVDHHQEPQDFADFVFWNEKAAATCELLYQMFEQLGWEQEVDSKAATCLYTGILTDTGSFRFDSTTSEIHRITGKLIDLGANPGYIHRSLFDNQKLERVRFLGYALNQKLTILPEYRLAYFAFSNEELQQFNSQKGDTDGVVNYGLSIENIIFSVIFIEKDGMIKISLRSVGDFSVSEFARQHFNGGGHKNASGGKSDKSLEETVQYFLNLLPTYKHQLLAEPS